MGFHSKTGHPILSKISFKNGTIFGWLRLFTPQHLAAYLTIAVFPSNSQFCRLFLKMSNLFRFRIPPLHPIAFGRRRARLACISQSSRFSARAILPPSAGRRTFYAAHAAAGPFNAQWAR